MVKRVLVKLPRKAYVEEQDREVTLSRFSRHIVDADKDFSTKYGKISKKMLAKKPGSVIRVGKESFYLLDAGFLDLYKTMKRGAQIISLKDIAAIIAHTGINRDSVVLDAGTGSGAFACYVAMIAKRVVSYDIEEDRLQLAKDNAKSLGIKNIDFKRGDVYRQNGVKERGFDVFLLDVPEPWKALKTAERVVKIGGYVVTYTPQVHQAQKVVTSLPRNMLHEKTIEVQQRPWLVDEKRLRPEMGDMLHTAFLTFVRRIK